MEKEKKEIWVEKLIELLNEYGNEICNHWGDYQTDMDFTDRDTHWYLSKKFWFIKWLVENDKIDIDNEELVSLMSELWEWRNPVKCLLMLLSIQDEPIRFLCEIIK